MTAVPFDFRRPPPGGLEGKVAAWLAEACAATPRRWAGLLPFSAGLRTEAVEPATPAAALQPLPETALGFRLTADGFPGADAVLALPRPLLLALVAGTLGEPVDELPPDRPLTPVEDALADYLLATLVLEPLRDAWPLQPPLQLTAAERGPPRKVCPLPPADVAVAARLAVDGPFGAVSAVLLLSRSGPIQLLTRQDAAAANDRAAAEAVVRALPTVVSVTLGTAEVPLSRLAGLTAGDVVILGQRVTDPLTARIAGAAKFRVWPGAVGRRRAIQVESAATS